MTTSTPDQITAQDKGGGQFTPHEEGQFAAVCVDVINLGQRVEAYPGAPARIVDKAALVFVTDTDGATKDIAMEFSVSMHEKAKLRAFLEMWRGKSYTEEQAKAGVPLHKLVGQHALLSVEHKQSTRGRAYGLISAIAPLPKKLEAPSANGYVRPDYWAVRKAGYAEEAAKWFASQQHVVAKANAGEEDEEVPF